MRTRLFIGLCFLAVGVLKLIPVRVNKAGTITLVYDQLLPSLIVFSIICFFLLVVFIVLSAIQLRKSLKGDFVMNRLDLNLRSTFTSVAVWFVIVLATLVFSEDSLFYFENFGSYFFIILGVISTYGLVRRWQVRKSKPGYLAVDSAAIYLKSLPGKGKRQIESLKMVSYDPKEKAILLLFQEGLDDIKLYLTDYESKDVFRLISKIRQIKGDDSFVDQNVRNIFSGDI